MSILFVGPLSFRISYARPPDLISFGAGAFDLMRVRHTAAEYTLEYQFQIPINDPYVRFRPILGLMVTAKGSSYLYGGGIFDFICFEQLIFAPGICAGWYNQGCGKDLWYPLEFRSSLEIAYQFPHFQRVGVKLSHTSNANLGKKNPGEESVTFFLSFPVN